MECIQVRQRLSNYFNITQRTDLILLNVRIQTRAIQAYFKIASYLQSLMIKSILLFNFLLNRLSTTRCSSLQKVFISVISRHHIVLEVNDDLMRIIVSTVIFALLLVFAILGGLSLLLLSLSVTVDFILKIVFKL